MGRDIECLRKFSKKKKEEKMLLLDLPFSSEGDSGSIPGSGRSSGEGTGNPLQYSCLENPMDRGAWRATVCGIIRVGQDLALSFSFFLSFFLSLVLRVLTLIIKCMLCPVSSSSSHEWHWPREMNCSRYLSVNWKKIFRFLSVLCTAENYI